MAIEDTETIDAILYDSEKDKLNLTIIQVNNWESIPESLALLRKKIAISFLLLRVKYGKNIQNIKERIFHLALNALQCPKGKLVN